MPFIINPKKGFIVTANNRPMPENVNSDIGTLSNSITRSRRVTELIQEGIDNGRKFDYTDMLKIMNDTVDVMARDNTPIILRLSKQILSQLDKESASRASEAIKILNDWRGEMTEESIGASVYSVWEAKFMSSLLWNQIKD